MTFGGVPPQLINHGLLIQGWHYMIVDVDVDMMTICDMMTWSDMRI